MALANLRVRRICLHEVQKRNEDRQAMPVTYGTELLQLDGRGLEAFTSRVHSAFKSDAQCMDMTIASHGAGSIADLGSKIVTATDRQFVQQSRAFADQLNQHQHSRSIPGGLVVVFDGTVGNPSTQFFAVMKAEMHEGFLRGANLSVEFVESLFLSPKNKLYKIGFFKANNSPAQALPEGWSAVLYDKQLSARDREGAAGYFHGSFLGLEIPESSAHQTRKFFEKTRHFIGKSDLAEEDKVDLYNSLYAYLKVDQSPTVQVGAFADRFMNDDLGESYRDFMRSEKFPARAIAKDLSEVSGSLRVRKFRFSQSIVLSGPPEAISNRVTIEVPEAGAGEAFTVITIRGELESQD